MHTGAMEHWHAGPIIGGSTGTTPESLPGGSNVPGAVERELTQDSASAKATSIGRYAIAFTLGDERGISQKECHPLSSCAR